MHNKLNCTILLFESDLYVRILEDVLKDIRFTCKSGAFLCKRVENRQNTTSPIYGKTRNPYCLPRVPFASAGQPELMDVRYQASTSAACCVHFGFFPSSFKATVSAFVAHAAAIRSLPDFLVGFECINGT